MSLSGNVASLLRQPRCGHPRTHTTDGAPTYLGRGDPAGRFADYYPAWVEKMAGDITLEGSLPDGAVQGAEAARAVIGGVRELYDRQDFNFAGPWQAQHIAANYRPLSSLMFLFRLLRERVAGAPYAELFLAGEA